MTLAIEQAAVNTPKKKNGMLPVLIALFLISYGLMSALVIEQGRTIEAQRGLITNLFSDSVELKALKMKDMLRQRESSHPSTGGQSQISGPQAQMRKQDRGAGALQPRAMQKPPKPTADAMDSRRIPLSI